jgi:hypothetical protein
LIKNSPTPDEEPFYMKKLEKNKNSSYSSSFYRSPTPTKEVLIVTRTIVQWMM